MPCWMCFPAPENNRLARHNNRQPENSKSFLRRMASINRRFDLWDETGKQYLDAIVFRRHSPHPDLDRMVWVDDAIIYGTRNEAAMIDSLAIVVELAIVSR